jgi:mannitol-1-phosphate/altronate dehydrogenase
MPRRTFVGFGFGPIQSALFLFEAYMSGNFSRFVVAEIDPELVKSIRDNGGAYTVNIARKGWTDRVTVHNVEIYNPHVPADRALLIDAIVHADEMATALPSVSFYDRGGPGSVAAMLGEALRSRRPSHPAVIYAAENHNRAAELLHEAILRYSPPAALDNIQCLNTVVGKMSGVIPDAQTIADLKLACLTPGSTRSVLVEEFNRILISRITLKDFRRGIEVFEEKDNLLPFEEAKLYGHNAIHALIGYLCDLRELRTMSQAADHPDIMATAHAAFIDECGAALIRKHGHLGDPLFTPAGFEAYAEDLLERMVRPNLHDLVARVIRDHIRKLGWDDRLFGAMRLALAQGIRPVHMAKGAAAAVLSLARHSQALPPALAGINLDPRHPSPDAVGRLLGAIWGDAADDQAHRLIDLTFEAMRAIL